MDGWFRGLVALYIHQDRLMWNRAQTLGVLQAAAFGGGYPLFASGRIGWAVALVVGCLILTVILLLIILRDQQVRGANKALIQDLGRDAMPTFELNPEPDVRSLGMRGDRWIIISTCALVLSDVVFLTWHLSSTRQG